MKKLTEMDTENSNAFSSRSFRQSTESNPFDELDHHVGSAVLGGDVPSPASQSTLFMQGQAEQPRPHDEIGFSAFGAASEMPSFRDMMQRHQYPLQQTPQNSQYTIVHSNEPMSPTNTNPYQSPEGERPAPDDHDTDDSDATNMHQGVYGLGTSSRQFNPTFEGAASDRSQTSSAGLSRGFPNLGGLGGLGGIGTAGAWSTAPGIVGTPSRANLGFTSGLTDSMFSSLGETQSASYISSAAFSNAGSAHFGNIGSVGRGSKMGSLFPIAMQDQMRGNDTTRCEHGYIDGRENTQANLARTAVGLNAPGFGSLARDTDSPSQQSRGMLDDLFGNLDGRGRGTQNLPSSFPAGDSSTGAFSQGSASVAAQASAATASTMSGLPPASAPSTSSTFGRSPETDNASGASNQMPATQQRQMVMPDRMRWIYRDPQGNTQGPWSGLEMHDWYKAGFFSPELQVKKQEDLDYEPLAQLIRRIGNSREPFLVPQIGIPHGPASTQANNTPSVLGTVPAASPSVQTGSAQPPFASSFPSFGTTLTAEQQNALERRKQEEQYLMARQKEHLAQQQVLIKQMQHMQGGPHSIHAQQLHHHSSAHSLQSQPSYGSITSPTGYQLNSAQPQLQQHVTMPGFFDSQARSSMLGMGPVGSVPENLHSGRDNEVAAAMERLNLGRPPQAPFGNLTQNLIPQEGLSHQQQVAAMFQDRARLQREQDQFDPLQRASLGESQDTMSRFGQFKELRAQEEDQAQFYQSTTTTKPPQRQSTELKEPPMSLETLNETKYNQEVLHPSLSQQTGTMGIEQAPSIAGLQKHAPSAQTQSPWTTVEAGLPMPFPPPQSDSPLPAPAAQRNRQHVADALAAESRSRSQTPSVETPSAVLAPWAKDSFEGLKGPSLKEIQEAEARQTAQQEEIAAAARRALADQERQNQAQPIMPTAGLPSSANWASGGSPATPTSASPSAWAKPLAGKQSAAILATGAKKPLAQIQKEEEARKSRVAAAAAANAVNNIAGIPALPGGKRYADLAGKSAAPINTSVSGAWTTVGAGGKLKTPVGMTSTPTPSPVPRNVSSGSAATATVAAKPKPVPTPIRSNTASGSSASQSANDELYKWTKGALGKGLNSSINGVY